ncbi:unnamed protein product [Phytophthora lilii]|uniref:Unnamed protein product n=1 Tax=Phytophthora lilii TaxID=2077276 RepID=A0A9W6TRX5_9STRA|nr:unnamed protein product [Phytophthora lilii]
MFWFRYREQSWNLLSDQATSQRESHVFWIVGTPEILFPHSRIRRLEVGVAGSAFPVDINDILSVGHLKKAIKEEKTKKLKDVDADELQIFLAKTEDGGWLDGAGLAGVTLDETGAPVSRDENGTPQGFEKMDSLLWIKNDKHFGKNFRPAEGDVHVLVVVPGHVRVDIGGTASRALNISVRILAPNCLNILLLIFLCRAGYRRWIINAQCFVPVILAVITIIVLAFGENATDEKAYLTVPGRSLIVCQMIGVDIAVGTILSSQHWKSKLDNMIEEAKDETRLQAQRQEMT